MAPKVVVIGGGVAGLSASLAAARQGAEVTLVESSKRAGLSKALMPLLISGGLAEADLLLPQAALVAEAGVQVRTGETVTAIQHAERKAWVGGGSPPGRGAAEGATASSIGFDSVVVCTGTAIQTPQLRGLSKPNVFVLKGPADYLGLSAALDALRTVVVLGPVPLALRLGEIVATRGKRVQVYCGRDGLARQFSEPVAAAIRREASARHEGVSLVDGSVDSILGVERAEAVVSSGSVTTCDGVVVVPRSVPAVPAVECQKGRDGGLLVDTTMSTTLPRVFAAGDSAEMRFKSGSVPARLYSTSLMGGEVAGTNAAGGSATAAPSWAAEQTYFGLELCSAGLGEQEAAGMGLDAATETSESQAARAGAGGPYAGKTLVSLVYDRATHRVYGLQIAGWRASSLSSTASLIVALGLTVEQLQHVESPYSPGLDHEVSPITLTAGRIRRPEGA